MGLMRRFSAIGRPMTAYAGPSMDSYNRAFFAGDPLPDLWLSALSASGMSVTPDLAMTLSAFYCGVTTIAYDLATLPLRAFRTRADGGLDQVTASVNSHEAGIASLVHKLQWQPNRIQTSAEFFVSQVASLEMRNIAYAEIVPGQSGFMEELLPRHPDRVQAERLPNGHLRYKLTEFGGAPRYLTDEEMFVIRDLSADGGLTVMSRAAYGANTFGTGLAAEKAAGRFFKTGMTAAAVATYPGEADDEYEEQLHKSISRYAAGADNTMGLLVVPDMVKVSNLAVEPDKAQMMLAREWTVYEVARMLRMSPRKLMVRGKADGFASVYQDSIDHVVNCLRPRAVLIQQSVQRDLVIAKDLYRFIFNFGELLKYGDPQQMGAFIQQLIQSRAMTPSEVRVTYLDLNASDHLDQLSEGDFRPGTSAGTTTPAKAPQKSAPADGASGRLLFRGFLAIQDNAVRCLRRERAAVEKLATKHAADPAAWQAGLRDFYADYAGFVAQTMRIPITIARVFAAEHGAVFEEQGIVPIAGEAGAHWEREEAEALATLALAGERAA